MPGPVTPEVRRRLLEGARSRLPGARSRVAELEEAVAAATGGTDREKQLGYDLRDARRALRDLEGQERQLVEQLDEPLGGWVGYVGEEV